jgi:hypothetical protein
MPVGPTTVRRSSSGLLDALSLILPAPEDTWLLRACLHSGDLGRHAWDVYHERVKDPRQRLKKDRRGVKALAPLLYAALRRNGVPVDGSLLTSLRTVSLREELRSRSYRHILQDVLSALIAGDIPHIVVTDAALAETVYEDPALRHCHSIDLLLHDGDLRRAARLLPPVGFAPSAVALGLDGDHLALYHDSGLPLELHRRLFRNRWYDVPPKEVWARSQEQMIAGLRTRILSPADNLLHVCILAASSSNRTSLQWVSDAWHIITRYPDLDWDAVIDCATRHHQALPLSVTLGYLAEHLHAPIPGITLERLHATASQADRVTSEVAVSAALASTRGILTHLVRMTGGWRPRLIVVKWILFPSRDYLRSAYHVGHSWLLPFYYVYRPLRYIARRIWWRCRDYLQLNAPQKHLMPPGVKPGA